MIVRTRTPLRVERERDVSVRISTNGNGDSPTGPSVVLLPGDELRFPGNAPGEELIVEIDLREISSSNYAHALLRLKAKEVHNDDKARQMSLFQ